MINGYRNQPSGEETRSQDLLESGVMPSIQNSVLVSYSLPGQRNCPVGKEEGKRTILKAAGCATEAHPVALALDLGTGDVRGATAGSTPTNASIVGFLELFHLFPLQPELVTTAHVIPTSRGVYGTSAALEKPTWLAALCGNWYFKNRLGEEHESEDDTKHELCSDPREGAHC